MVEEKRRINLHGTVKEKSHYKSYRVEATPIGNILTEILAMWLIMQFMAFLHTGKFEPFSNIWPWYSILGVIAYHVYKWVEFKLEKR